MYTYTNNVYFVCIPLFYTILVWSNVIISRTWHKCATAASPWFTLSFDWSLNDLKSHTSKSISIIHSRPWLYLLYGITLYHIKHTHPYAYTHSTSHYRLRTFQLPATVKVRWTDPTRLQLLSSDSIGTTITPATPVHSQQLLTSHSCLWPTVMSSHWLSLLPRSEYEKDVLSSEKAVYVGDVTFHLAAFPSVIIHDCGLCFCL